MEHDRMLLPSEGGSMGHGEQTETSHSPRHKLPDFGSLCDQTLASQSSSYSPPSYPQTSDTTIPSFPECPTTELAPIRTPDKHSESSKDTLPPLSALATPPQHFQRDLPPDLSDRLSRSPLAPQGDPWPSLNPFTTYYTPSHAQPAGLDPQKMDIDTTTNNTGSAVSPDGFHGGRGSSLSLDDPDVRMAAEALGDLRADFVSSPPTRHTSLPSNPSHKRGSEPLLSLLTTSHPLLATTIEGATSAYNSSKNFSPTLRTGAEYVEGYLGPIANTVGSVGRVTGVEGGVRWFLQAGRRHQSSESDFESHGGGRNKRRKVEGMRGQMTSDGLKKEDMEMLGVVKEGRSSTDTIDTLPAYDQIRTPAYTRTDSRGCGGSRQGSSGSPWRERIIMSTSGLSIAMSEESLRSLKYCLGWLRWANERIAKALTALKLALDEYDGTLGDCRRAAPVVKKPADKTVEKAAGKSTDARPQMDSPDPDEIAARITALRGDILKTFSHIFATISKYASGALPENARALIRRHLTSLPKRFELASMQEALVHPQGASDDKVARQIRENGRRILVMAREGLDMLAQVSGVLDGTIVSAEDWCEKLGKKKKEEWNTLLPRTSTGTTAGISGADRTSPPLTGVTIVEDVKIG